MIDELIVSDTLELFADKRTAATRGRDVKPLKGLRGVPDGEIARIAASVWEEHGVDLDVDHGALDRLYGNALEDGLVAIGLVSAALPDAPWAALDLGRRWLDVVDDPITADALGWLVLGPAMLATQTPVSAVVEQVGHLGPAAQRALVAAGLAWTPEPLTGPAAAPLRARIGDKRIRFVEAPWSPGLTDLLDATWRHETPAVRKVLRRVVRAWAKADPEAVVAWADGVRGGLPKLLSDEVRKARRAAERAS